LPAFSTMKKQIFLLDINHYQPEITALTLPFIKVWAEKIGADIFTITERKFPDWPVTYEKMQIYELAQQIGADWNIYIDLDTLIHPECPDFTAHLDKSVVAIHNYDVASVRFKMDKYFWRDGRYFAFGNWFTVASDWCVDLWKPLDITLEQALDNIRPTPHELSNGITREHLIDDYTLTRNLARYGIKFTTFVKMWQAMNTNMGFLQHRYIPMHDEPNLSKIDVIKGTMKTWHLENYFKE